MHPAALPLLALLFLILLLLARAAWVVRHLWYAGPPAVGRDAVPLLAERRAHNWVGAPSSDLVARAVRALSSDTDRLLFVRMRSGADLRCDVLGSTGNLYAVVIGRVCSCTCPDWARRGGNCKHLLYTKLRVLKLPRESPLLWQTAYLSMELTYMLAHLAHPRAVEGRATGVVLRALGEEAERTPVGLGAPCPVCFCDLDAFVYQSITQSCGQSHNHAVAARTRTRVAAIGLFWRRSWIGQSHNHAVAARTLTAVGLLVR